MGNRKLTLSQDRTRTLADRIRPTIARNAGIPEVVTVGAMVAPLADAYSSKQEATKLKRLTARAALQSGRSAVAELHARMRMWSGTLARDLPGYERAEIDAPASNPEGVVADARQLVRTVREQGGDLAYASMLVADLSALADRAEHSWSLGQTELAELQVMQGELRSDGVRFLSGLVRLRIVLRVTLGSEHRDYRALRASRRSEDTEVPEVEETEEHSVTAAREDGTA